MIRHLDDAIADLHRRVDAAAARVASAHGDRLTCRHGCATCCVDDLTVFGVEALRIRRHAARVLRAPVGPTGACAFLGADRGCRVYDLRPYVCRTQGLPLRWFAETEDGEVVEERDVCPLNLDGPDLVTLDESVLWQLGPMEADLYLLQARHREGARVSLRRLFLAPAVRRRAARRVPRVRAA